MELLNVRRIWDEAPHNAFTDLVRFRRRWYCAFREGSTHVSDDGRLRVIRSDDGESWTSVACMRWDGGDLRDAKLSVTASGQLMLSGAVRFLKPVGGSNHHSVTWFSEYGEEWSAPFADCSGLGTWRWSVTWHGGVAYSFGYGGKDRGGCLYRSTDGKSWDIVAQDAYPDGPAGSETSLVFSHDDTAYCLLRRQGSAMLGSARAPYTDWEWHELGVEVGGPKMISFDTERFLAAVRLYDGRTRTSLCWVDREAGTLTETLALPSGGDTSYAGMVWHEGSLRVSYYASHEQTTAIYLARVKVPQHRGR